ncbi:MAG TPA: cytochrome c-type biogenesis protein [Gaiellaceae bacterium]|nr:cytochrome c-type biogenesis protein [Gaiellaceae bacterium]
MSLRVAVLAVLALLLATPSSASRGRPTLAQVEHEVMCPTCHTLLELSHAPIADRMRAFIRRRIAAGDDDAQIKHRLVAEFGEGVLAAPPAQGFGLVAWLLPAAGFLAVAAIVATTLRRWRRDHRLEQTAVAEEQLDPALVQRLERALARFDD